MPPSDPLVRAANTALADAAVQETVKQMHAQGVPLSQMVDALGLGEEMSGRIRAILDGLAPDVVEGIRQATLAALQNPQPALPLDCQLTEPQIQLPVVVDVVPESGVQTIRVQLAQS